MVFPASVLLCTNKMALFARLRGVTLRREGGRRWGSAPDPGRGIAPAPFSAATGVGLWLVVR